MMKRLALWIPLLLLVSMPAWAGDGRRAISVHAGGANAGSIAEFARKLTDGCVVPDVEASIDCTQSVTERRDPTNCWAEQVNTIGVTYNCADYTPSPSWSGLVIFNMYPSSSTGNFADLEIGVGTCGSEASDTGQEQTVFIADAEDGMSSIEIQIQGFVVDLADGECITLMGEDSSGGAAIAWVSDVTIRIHLLEIRDPEPQVCRYTSNTDCSADFSCTDADSTILADCIWGGIITNCGAAGSVEVELPDLTDITAPRGGMNFTVINCESQTFAVDPAGTPQKFQSVSDAGDKLTSSTKGQVHTITVIEDASTNDIMDYGDFTDGGA